jgi:2-polyprenyl-6-methoxyphenol hydroxylase-like FAD-dependent oxidoreductase
MARTVVVVGGGVGGLAVAAGLHRRGWSVRVLEQAPEFTAVGAGIALWPNAFRALEVIGAEVTGGKLGAVGGLRDWRGRWIIRMEDDPTVAAQAAGAVVAHRAELLSALLAGVPAECRQSGVRVSGVRVEGGRAVVEHDQGEVAADLVVGADGLRSVVRAALWPDARPPRYSGRTAWRLVLRRPPGLDTAEARAEIWGPGSLFGMFPLSGDRMYCYGTATVPAGGSAPDELAEVRRRFGDWCDPIPAVLAAARQEEVLRNDIYYLPPLSGYVSGPVALLGDAAHAMTPNLAQGGCQALEDAAVLTLTLDAAPDVATALREYDRLRRPRTRAIARMSRLSGGVAQLSWAPARAIRDAVLHTMPRSMLMKSVTAPLNWQPTPPDPRVPA